MKGTGHAIEIRAAVQDDMPGIREVQGSSPEASQWNTEDYLRFDCRVAVCGKRVAAFVVSRSVAPDEREILNVAVHHDLRRRGLATRLLRDEMERWPGVHFLEVRESNRAARRLYEKLGFAVVGSRPGYYDDPPEPGIVMRVCS